jgi:hypothetical protein
LKSIFDDDDGGGGGGVGGNMLASLVVVVGIVVVVVVVISSCGCPIIKTQLGDAALCLCTTLSVNFQSLSSTAQEKHFTISKTPV